MIQEILSAELADAGRLDLSELVTDATFTRAKKGGEDIGLTKRGKRMKLEVVVDGKGLPRGTVVAAANIAETALPERIIGDVLIELPANVPLLADKGYDSDLLRDPIAKRKIVLLSLHRKGRTKSCRNDGRRMRFHARRYVIERTNQRLDPLFSLPRPSTGISHLHVHGVSPNRAYAFSIRAAVSRASAPARDP